MTSNPTRFVRTGKVGKRMRTVPRSIEVNAKPITTNTDTASHVPAAGIIPADVPIVYCYKAVDYHDDLDVLLSSKRRKEARNMLMRWRVDEAMAQKMDTGIRVNQVLARMHGQSVPSPPRSTYISTVPHDTTSLYLTDLNDRNAKAQGIMLVGVCRTEDVRTRVEADVRRGVIHYCA